jgi:hypothetical protein
MIINPNDRSFRPGPGHFHQSPIPGPMRLADTAFQALMERSRPGQTNRRCNLSQAGAQAWNQATQMLWKTKATLAGDLLGDVWSKVAWIESEDDTIAGLLAEVPFALTSDPSRLLGAMASVAVDLGAERCISDSCRRMDHRHRRWDRARSRRSSQGQQGWIPPASARTLPWGKYNREVDQEWVRTFINIDAAGVTGHPLFSPPTDAIPGNSRRCRQQDNPRTVLGKIFAPFANKTVQYNGGYGCLPGHVPRRRSRPVSQLEPAAELRAAVLQQRGDRPAARRVHADRRLLPGAPATRRDHVAADRGRRPRRVQGRLREDRAPLAGLVLGALRVGDGAGPWRLPAPVPRPEGARGVAPRRERLRHLPADGAERQVRPARHPRHVQGWRCSPPPRPARGAGSRTV